MVLPLPDSPTRPRISPGLTREAHVLHHRLAGREPQAQVLDPDHGPAAVGAHATTLRAVRGHVRAAEAAGDRVAHQVHADREQGDHRRRCQHRPHVERDVLAVLADHERPVGAGRLEAEAEVVDRGDDQDRVREAKARVDQHGREDVGQHLADDDGGGPLAAGDGGLDVAPHRHLERRRADDAADPRRLDGGDADHEHADAGTRARDEDEQEEQRRERQHDVDRPHQQRVELRAGVAGDEPDREPDRVAQSGRRRGQADDRAAAVEQAAQDVSAQEVGPEVRRRRRPGERRSDGRRSDRAGRCSVPGARRRPRARRRRGRSRPERIRRNRNALLMPAP